MKGLPIRTRFGDRWPPVIMFLLLATLTTFWPLLGTPTRWLAAVGTSVASLAVGLIAWWFLTREGVRAQDIGLGRQAWSASLVLFASWWAVVTAVDWGGRWLADLFGISLSTFGSYEWSPTTVLEMASKFVFVGFAEEIAFRGYLHNKLVVVIKRRWLAIALAALAFGLWHLPADLATRAELRGPLLNAGLFFLFSLIFFNLPYEWKGLLPLLALFHGWNDFPILVTLQPPTLIGIVAGYLLIWPTLWAYGRLVFRQDRSQLGAY